MEHQGLRVSCVRERFQQNLDVFVFSYRTGCGHVEQVAVVSWRLVHRDLANSHGGDRSADYTDLKE